MNDQNVYISIGYVMVSDLKRVEQKDEQKKPDGDYFEMQVFIFSIFVPTQS